MIKYWINIISGSKSKFSYMVYRHLLYRNRHCKWLTCIRNTLDLTGHSDVFLNQNNTRNSSYILIKRTFIDQFIQEWNCKLEGSNKGKQSKLFKDNIELETYVMTLPIPYVSHYLSFEHQTTNFPLRLEGGATPLTMNVLCRFCRNDIGDSFHYLLVCKYLKNKRKLLIDKYYYTRPNVLKYKQLLCHENVAILKRLSLFASHIMKIVC